MTNNSAILSKNPRVNDRIHELLALLCTEDRKKFLRKFNSEDNEQSHHTFRELLIGAYLLKNCLNARYDQVVQDKTPDWSVREESGELSGLVEQLTFHQARELDHAMNATLRAGQTWVGWVPSAAERIYQKVLSKAEVYEKLANSLSVPYIITLFADFAAAVEIDEIHDACLKLNGGGVFSAANHLSGVVFFEENKGKYEFQYIPNPHAPRPIYLVGATL
jgi:hypothetical protein